MCTGKNLAWTADIRDWARSYQVVILHVYCARRAPFRRARCEEVELGGMARESVHCCRSQKLFPGRAPAVGFCCGQIVGATSFPGAQTTKPIATLLVSEQEVRDQAQSMDT